MISQKDVIIIDLPGSTSYNSLRQLGYKVQIPYAKSNRWHYRLRTLLHYFRLDKYSFLDSLYSINSQIINQKKPDLIIIIGSLIFQPYLRKLRKLFPKTTIIYSYSNIVDCIASVNPRVLKRYNILGYSWDKRDCNKYELNYQRPSFNPNIIDTPKDVIKSYDICFIGADKGRYKLVKAIDLIASASGFRTYIHITPDFSFLKKTHKDYKDGISYDRYLEIISSSGCFIDIVQKGQVGTTMRTMEAIFSNKKLISNNSRLKEYDFYHPNNIFILTEDNIYNIPNFLRIPYIPIKEDILKKYSLKYSIEELLESIVVSND